MDTINNSVFTADMTTTLAVNMACRWIDDAPTISQWIPVMERLPKQQYINGVPLYQEFFVTVAERQGEDWRLYRLPVGSY